MILFIGTAVDVSDTKFSDFHQKCQMKRAGNIKKDDIALCATVGGGLAIQTFFS